MTESLAKKVKAVSTGVFGKIRKVTDAEANEIRECDGWFDGWFTSPNGGQVTLGQRDCGQHVIRCIGF
jgi:hypothetical protein